MPAKKEKKGGNNDFKFELGSSGKPILDDKTKEALMPVLQNKLDSLVGQDSGYLDTLPQSVQQRIKALKSLQTKYDAFQEQFDKEVAELEKKYDGLKKPLFTRRAEIVKGVSEPTAEELVGGEDEKKEDKKAEKTEDNVKGIPEFWLQALKHNFELEALVQPHDEPLLKLLEDVMITFPDPEDNNSFSIEFHFSSNDYFEDKVLSKTFKVKDGMLEGVETSGIKWKSGKNITVKMEAQKQGGGRGGRGGRRGGRGGKGGDKGGPVKMVEVPVDSFFHFFDDIDMETEEEDEQELIEQEFDLGMAFRSLVEDAVKWFTGEVPMEGYEGMGMDDEDDDEDDEDDDEDDAPAPKAKGGKKVAIKVGGDDDDDDEDEEYDPSKDTKAQAQPECKQQ